MLRFNLGAFLIHKNKNEDLNTSYVKVQQSQTAMEALDREFKYILC